MPGSGEPIFQAAAANFNPWTEAKVDTKNPERGPGREHEARDRSRVLDGASGSA